MKVIRSLFVLVAATLLVVGLVAPAPASAGNGGNGNNGHGQHNGLKCPKNIIILISDGCGYQQIQAANLFTEGKLVAQAYERFPVKLGMST